MKFVPNDDPGKYLGACIECGGPVQPGQACWRRGTRADGYLYEHANCLDPDGSKAAEPFTVIEEEE